MESPLCTGRGTSACAVNQESLSPGEAARAGEAGPGPFAHRPAALVIGTAAVTTVLPEIPPETLAEWQRVVDLTARLARVPASLIMRTERPTHTVLVSSRTEGNPYAVGREYDLHAVLYCQGVFDNDGELVVEDATRDPVYDNEVRSHASLKDHTLLTLAGGHMGGPCRAEQCPFGPTAGTWSSSQWRPDHEFETDRG